MSFHQQDHNFMAQPGCNICICGLPETAMIHRGFIANCPSCYGRPNPGQQCPDCGDIGAAEVCEDYPLLTRLSMAAPGNRQREAFAALSEIERLRNAIITATLEDAPCPRHHADTSESGDE